MAEIPVSYQLLIAVVKPVSVQVGKLGVLDLPVCTCIYTGSAKRNLEARIARHLRADKKLRWHIDYLLVHPHVDVIEVKRSTKPECQLNQELDGSIVLHRFGASDCTNGCGSHLKLRS
ncbi:MAG: GIY-YIG nuclease family protein [Pseudomonadota bacterium]